MSLRRTGAVAIPPYYGGAMAKPLELPEIEENSIKIGDAIQKLQKKYDITFSDAFDLFDASINNLSTKKCFEANEKNKEIRKKLGEEALDIY